MVFSVFFLYCCRCCSSWAQVSDFIRTTTHTTTKQTAMLLQNTGTHGYSHSHTLPCNRKWYRSKCVYIYMLLDVKYRITNTVAPIKRTKRLNIKATETEWIKKTHTQIEIGQFFHFIFITKNALTLNFQLIWCTLTLTIWNSLFFVEKLESLLFTLADCECSQNGDEEKKMLCTSFYLFSANGSNTPKKNMERIDANISKTNLFS